MSTAGSIALSPTAQGSPARPKQRRMRAPVRREQVLDVATRVFAERGLTASMGEIATASGITRTVLYYYFPSKKDLLLAVLDVQATELLREIAPVTQSEGSPKKRVRAVLDALLGFVESHPLAWKVLFAPQQMEREPEVRQALDQVREATIATAAMIGSSDVATFDLDPASMPGRIRVEMIYGSILTVVQWWQANPSVPRDDIVKVMQKLLWAGLRGTRRSAP